ncbi:MAG: alpha-1,4-glucan--maltose-1-phosphate maltosyltransferase, partial [Actinobacteria bacterium]|nr:alpha-1,4-glucan--maltose-1-phosphate maltosyltransferase [Actinomycetota bacterium]
CWSKTDAATGDRVLVVVNLDPHGARETTVSLDLPEIAMDWRERFAVTDQITGETYNWGRRNYVRLDPFVEPAHIFDLQRWQA